MAEKYSLKGIRVRKREAVNEFTMSATPQPN